MVGDDADAQSDRKESGASAPDYRAPDQSASAIAKAAHDISQARTTAAQLRSDLMLRRQQTPQGMCLCNVLSV